MRLMSSKYPRDTTSASDSGVWQISSALHSTYASIDRDLRRSRVVLSVQRSNQSQLLSIKLWSSAEAEPTLNNAWLASRIRSPLEPIREYGFKHVSSSSNVSPSSQLLPGFSDTGKTWKCQEGSAFPGMMSPGSGYVCPCASSFHTS